MTYPYDSEVVESRWRLALASFRYAWRRKAQLYLRCAGSCLDWSHCSACRGTVLALRLIEEAER